MPNRLEASFKSNKCESKTRRCFKCSWDREIRKGSQSFSNSHKKSLVDSSPCSKESNIGSRGDGRSGVNAQMSVCPVVGQQWVRREMGGLYTNPEKLAVTVLKRVSSVLPTRCRYYRGVSLKPNSEGLSVVPTLGRYYRAPGKTRQRRLIGTTDPALALPTKAVIFRKWEQTCTCWL
jgi:hypothetical protein